MVQCPICKSEAQPYDTGSDSLRFDCPRCGEFDITGSLLPGLQSKLDGGIHRRALMSHNIRRMPRTKNKPPLISSYDERLWLGERVPTPQRQADDLILWVGDNQIYPDEAIRCALPFLSAWVGTSLNLAGANSGGVHWLSTYLANEKLLEARPFPGNEPFSAYDMRLTMEGWRKYFELKQKGAATSQAFVAMWFDDATEGAWTNGLSKGIADAGYDPLRINMKEHVNKICDEIIAEIRRSRFVVADYTGHRGGVYYEAGFAAGLGLTVIPTCRKDEMEQLHFDVRQYNCIDWQTPAELAQRLQARIEAVLGDGPRKQ
jgi:nucleoside 2-deoxyribosyltransferase